MSKAVILVHGIKTDASWSRGIGLFAPEFERRGYQVEIAAWNPGGWRIFFFSEGCARPIASTLARWAIHLRKLSATELVAVGHSHGCRLLSLASEYGAPFRAIAWLSAAVDRDVKIGRQVHWVLNYHSPGDSLVKIAALIPFHPWGSLGAYGFDSQRMQRDPRLKNFKADFSRQSDLRQYSIADHGDWFHPRERAEWWARKVADDLEASAGWSEA